MEKRYYGTIEMYTGGIYVGTPEKFVEYFAPDSKLGQKIASYFDRVAPGPYHCFAKYGNVNGERKIISFGVESGSYLDVKTDKAKFYIGTNDGMLGIFNDAYFKVHHEHDFDEWYKGIKNDVGENPGCFDNKAFICKSDNDAFVCTVTYNTEYLIGVEIELNPSDPQENGVDVIPINSEEKDKPKVVSATDLENAVNIVYNGKIIPKDMLINNQNVEVWTYHGEIKKIVILFDTGLG